MASVNLPIEDVKVVSTDLLMYKKENKKKDKGVRVKILKYDKSPMGQIEVVDGPKKLVGKTGWIALTLLNDDSPLISASK